MWEAPRREWLWILQNSWCFWEYIKDALTIQSTLFVFGMSCTAKDNSKRLGWKRAAPCEPTPQRAFSLLSVPLQLCFLEFCRIELIWPSFLMISSYTTSLGRGIRNVAPFLSMTNYYIGLTIISVPHTFLKASTTKAWKRQTCVRLKTYWFKWKKHIPLLAAMPSRPRAVASVSSLEIVAFFH